MIKQLPAPRPLGCLQSQDLRKSWPPHNAWLRVCVVESVRTQVRGSVVSIVAPGVSAHTLSSASWRQDHSRPSSLPGGAGIAVVVDPQTPLDLRLQNGFRPKRPLNHTESRKAAMRARKAVALLAAWAAGAAAYNPYGHEIELAMAPVVS